MFENIFGVGVGGIELIRIFGDDVGVAKYLDIGQIGVRVTSIVDRFRNF